jgi:uncharacterized membrane protein YccC
MIPLSTPAKEATKTALAMVIAYAISLWMGWENPKWAGFAVAMISLPMAGQSLNKGALRMMGTLAAVVAALILIGLFPQDRWWLLTCLSLYLAVCVYMLTGRKNQYFWFVGAFVALVIVVNSGGTSEGIFSIAMTRAQETGMGIFVYMLVSVFLWPRSSLGQLKQTSRELFSIQGRLYRTYRELMVAQSTVEEVQPLRMQQATLLPKVGQTLEAAESDSYEVSAFRDQWRYFYHLSKNLGEVLEHWRQSFPEIQSLDLPRLLPNLELFLSELGLRFEATERLLTGEVPTRLPSSISLFIDKDKIRALSPFQRAAVILTKSQLERLESLSQSLFDCVLDISGDRQPVSIPPKEEAPHGGIAIDPDRFMSAVRIVVHLWIAFLIWVYVDPPGHATFVQLSVTLGMAAMMVGVSASTMVLPFTVGSACVGVLYVFVMPQLSGYTELALLLFGWTFLAYYLFAQPHQGMARLGAMIPFLSFTGIQNHQTYSFSGFANSTTMLLLGISLVLATEYLFTSPRPEKVFLRLLARFFRHSEFLMSHLALDSGREGRLARIWKTAYYHKDLLELPPKLAKWGQQIDYRTFPNNTPEQVQALVTSLQDLAYRIKTLVDARKHPQAELLVSQLRNDLRTWRLKVEDQFHGWTEDPAAKPGEDLQARLAAKLTSMEARVVEVVDLAAHGELSDEDWQHFYRLLGSYRSLSEAMVGHARLAETFDFGQWREARF